jgi:hypothetical protein
MSFMDRLKIKVNCFINFSKYCLSVLIVSTDERSVSVAWDYSCNSNNPNVFFKVYLEHLEWKACPTGQKDSTRGPGKEIYNILCAKHELPPFRKKILFFGTEEVI